MSEKTLIVLFLESGRVPRNAEARIAELAGGRDVLVTGEKTEAEKVLDRIEIAAGDFPHALVAAAPRLAWFQQWYAGADWLQRRPEAAALPFVLTNASGIHGSQMAEHLFGMLLAWYKKFPEVFAAQQRREWFREAVVNRGEPAAGKNMLILGFGSIGREIGRVAAAFGMKVKGLRRSSGGGAPPGVDSPLGYESLYELLPWADVVVDVLPLTAETKNIADKKFFAAMKPSAVFANIGRGGTVNEEELAAALRAGTIAGALLDVTAKEPLPPDSPLWDAPGLILTPHYSGSHPQYDEIVLELFLDNLRRYTQGEALRNVVDKKRGY